MNTAFDLRLEWRREWHLASTSIRFADSAPLVLVEQFCEQIADTPLPILFVTQRPPFSAACCPRNAAQRFLAASAPTSAPTAACMPDGRVSPFLNCCTVGYGPLRFIQNSRLADRELAHIHSLVLAVKADGAAPNVRRRSRSRWCGGCGRRGRTATRPVPKVDETAPVAIPRIARLLALAILLEELIRERKIRDYAEAARLGYEDFPLPPDWKDQKHEWVRAR
jgi:hypothetical protein